MLAKTRSARQATFEVSPLRSSQRRAHPYRSMRAISSDQVAGPDGVRATSDAPESNAIWPADEQSSRRDKAHFVAREQWDERPR